MVKPRTWPPVLCLFFLIAATFSTLGQVVSAEAEVKDDTTKTECRKHIEEALSKYWDQETGTYQVIDGPNPDISNESPKDLDQITSTAESVEVNETEKACDDDDKDGICNEDEVDEVPLKKIEESVAASAFASAAETAPSSSCPDDDNDGICNEDEVDEGAKEDTNDDDDDEDDEEVERKASKKKRANKRRSKYDEDEDGDDEDDDDSSRRRRKRKSRQNDEEDDEKESKKRRKRKNKYQKRQDDEDDDDNDDDDEEEADRKSRKNRQNKNDDNNESQDKSEVTKKEEKKVEKPAEPEPQVESEPESEPEEQTTSGRSHVDEILRLGEIGSKEDNIEQNLILSIFKDLKKIYTNSIKPLEQMYKFREISTRLISDAEIFAKPMVLFLGPKGSGKTSLVNYLLGLQSTPWQLNTGISTSYPHFTLLLKGDAFTKLSPTELSADFTFSGLQQFGQHFVEHHLQAFKMPLDILQKMTLVDCPGYLDESMMPKEPGKGIDSEVYQWFIDRSDVIYIVIDVNQLHLTSNLHSILEQLRGRDVRFIISKSDEVTHSQIVTLIGQLLWALSPLMTNNQPPKVFALTTQMETYEPFLDLQEQEWLQDLSDSVSGLARVEAHIAEVRRHAVRVRNHAKIIDCYLATYYRNKGLFMFGQSAKKFATEITDNPSQYRVFSGALASQAQNISRYDLPDPELYRDFFRSNNLLDFKQLAATCSFFKGCPLDKLDVAISYQLPDLVSKYKKLTKHKVN